MLSEADRNVQREREFRQLQTENERLAFIKGEQVEQSRGLNFEIIGLVYQNGGVGGGGTGKNEVFSFTAEVNERYIHIVIVSLINHISAMLSPMLS